MRPVLSRISNNGYQVTIQLCCIFIIVKVHLAIILINELFQNNYGLIETNKWIPFPYLPQHRFYMRCTFYDYL
jgi:hypothetical protein